MHKTKFFKYLSTLMIMCMTLVTCSGCFDAGFGEPSTKTHSITLGTAPANVTYRKMDEDLFMGYLGAHRDFILIVDNIDYNYDNNVGLCKENEDIGCSSMMAQLLINYGIKAGQFALKPDERGTDKNVLIYYASSKEFSKYGALAEAEKWINFLTPSILKSDTQSEDFNRDDLVLKNLCGSRFSKYSVCDYSDEMNTKGYSTVAGQSMMLFYDDGDLSRVVKDNDIDPNHILDNPNSTSDNVYMTGDRFKGVYEEYYKSMANYIELNANVSITTVATSNAAEKREFQHLETLSQLTNLVEGKGSYAENRDFLLLITSNGYINEKIGNNSYYPTVEDALNNRNLTMDKSLPEGDALDQLTQSFIMLMNTSSTYDDNCAAENALFLNFLKEALTTLYETVKLIGKDAAIGAAIGAAIPLPGLNLATAVAGGVIGGLVGFFKHSGEIKELVNNLLSNDGNVSGDKYCKVVTSALADFEINVPIYTYNINSFLSFREPTKKGNLEKYLDTTHPMEDQILKEYYDTHRTTCLTQTAKIDIPDNLLSLFVPTAGTDFLYADKCEIDLVKKIVGGFNGSPSILLFNQGKKADDLYGRMTSSFIREVAFSWGLTTIGYTYNLDYKNTMDEMSVTIGSAQKLKDLQYCVSNNRTPGCNSGESVKSISSLNYLTGKYINALDAKDGIHIDFTDLYNEMSSKLVSDKIRNGEYSNLELNNRPTPIEILNTPGIDNSQGESTLPDSGGNSPDEGDIVPEPKVKFYKKVKMLDFHWKPIEMKESEYLNLEAKIKNELEGSEWSEYKYLYTPINKEDPNDKSQVYYYLKSGDKVIGYRIANVDNIEKKIIEYYSDGNNEYIFENKQIDKTYANAKYLTIDRRKDSKDINLQPSLKGVYVYMTYIAEDGERGVYTYAL